MSNPVLVPLSVPQEQKEVYVQNYKKITFDLGKLFLFAGDQKIEHLNSDFYGKDISTADATPEHMFKIASKAKIGAFATQLGLISRYGMDYKNINYVLKLNSKTNLVLEKQKEPLSLMINDVDDVVQFKCNSKLNIVGVGYTVYLGSEYESQMLREAAQVVLNAHQNGMIAILWMYPRGKAVKDQNSTQIIAGAAGVAACLGADFVKVNPPKAKNSEQSAHDLKQAVLAAGRTKVICSGGTKKDEELFLKELKDQINLGGACGCAIGRNVHQRNLDDAIKFCNKITEIIYK
ncbi:aldolase [Candidatus Dependentiae bacterium]